MKKEIKMDLMTVSLCVVAYNEEKYLPGLLLDLSKQSYPHDLTEIILIDGNSSDNTKNLMMSFANDNYGFRSIRIFDNPKRIQASGWNIALMNATGDVVIRIDAHSKIPSDFTTKNINLQKKGEMVTGGMRPCIIEEKTLWKTMLLGVENSLFGSSISKSRRKSEKSYVSSVFHAAYRKEVISNVGLFNENLLRTEDNEYHYRVRNKGYKICYDPEIVSFQYARSKLSKMIKQKFGNGYWIGITMGICPKCVSMYHLVPLAFVFGVILTSCLLFFGINWPSIIMWSLYVLFSYYSAFQCVKNHAGNLFCVFFPFVFCILHISYGIGTAFGIIRIPVIRKKTESR